MPSRLSTRDYTNQSAQLHGPVYNIRQILLFRGDFIIFSPRATSRLQSKLKATTLQLLTTSTRSGTIEPRREKTCFRGFRPGRHKPDWLAQGGGGGGGGTLIFSINIGWADFLGSKLFISIIFGFSVKVTIFGGWRLLWIFLGVTSIFGNVYWLFLWSAALICVLWWNLPKYTPTTVK